MIDSIIKYPTHTFHNKRDIIEKLNYFKKISSDGLEKLPEKEIELLIKEFNTFFNLHVTFFADIYPAKLYRVTINKYITKGKYTKLQKITDLIGPPKELTNIGRCNLKGESVFYAALDTHTALWETKPMARFNAESVFSKPVKG